MDERTIEDIKSRTDLVELISSYGVQVKLAGGSAKACCPFHHEKTPSFHINSAKGFYHCFGCGESGDAIKFVQKQEGLTFMEAVKKLAERCGVKITERADPQAGKRKRLMALMAELAAFYRRCLLKTREAETARAYLAKRDLPEEIGEEWNIGYAPSGVVTILKWAEKYRYTPEELEAAGVIKAPSRPGDRGYHRFGGRLMFSIRDREGRVVAFSGRQLVADRNSGKYVNSPETPIFTKGRVLFGFDKAAATVARVREVLVCEGQIDCIRLHACGFRNAVAGQGTAFTEEHVRMLARVADAAVLVYDDDAAGHKATIRSAGMLLAAGLPVRVVSLPGGEDPDSFLRKFGAEAFQKLVDDAESIVSFQVRVERAKEKRADSIDAVNRVTKAVLATLARTANAVLKASLTAEAAKLMSLPMAALAEELAKVKVAVPVPASAPVEQAEEPVAEEVMPPIPGEDAHLSLPPPPQEFAFMQFLMANERNGELDAKVGELLPREVFAHDFTARFVAAWRAARTAAEDPLAAFADALPAQERAWFDAILVDAEKSRVSSLSVSDIFEDYARRLWREHLGRLRGALPAAGDAEADCERMRLSMEMQQFAQGRWGRVKELIRARC